MDEITRPILWNVGPLTKTAMYVLLVVSSGIFAWGFYRRLRVWRRGAAASGLTLTARDVVVRLVRHVLLQMRIARIPTAWGSHMAIFYGFIVLFIGTVIVGLEHYGIFGLVGIRWTGGFYVVTSLALDLFGLAFVVAIPVAMLRRGGLTRVRPSSGPVDAAILWLFLLIGVTGFLVEGLRIAFDMEAYAFERRVSFVGWWLATAFRRGGIAGDAVLPWHLASWWVHMVGVFVFIALVPYTKLLHALVAPANIALTAEPASGRLKPVSLEEVEETGRFGLARIEEFSWRQLLSFDACTHCRRCESACPAFATNKPLSPMRVILDIAGAGERDQSLHGDVISAETLWSCTTCGACVWQCPVLIDQMGTIVEMRRHLVGEGQVLGSAQSALRSIAATGNPWGVPREDRDAWAEGLDVPRVDEHSQPDVLLWVGCAGSYDRRNQRVTRALVEVLRAAGIDFAILGKRESCTGDPARRLGDEFTFLEQATANVETLSQLGFRRIVTQCAHCFNTIRNEYPDFGGKYEVVHHTQLINELLAAGKLKLQSPTRSDGEAGGALTFHDPCYLSRHNDGSTPAWNALEQLGGPSLPIVEPQQHGPETFCCGAGGGRMWMEEDIDKRVNLARWEQLKQTGATTVGVGCPFCMTMLDDASKTDDAAGIAVKDVAELVAERLSSPAGQ